MNMPTPKRHSDPAEGNEDTGRKEVDQYISAIPEPARSTLETVRETIRSVVPPEASEAITYRIPSFKYKGPLIGYAAFPNHCSLLVMSSTVLKPFVGELTGYKTSKGTIRFPVDQPLPADLVVRLVKARIAENEALKD